MLSQEVDAVIHNGATVHWVRTYQDMVASNVISTIDAMRVRNEGKPKLFAFVSSTALARTLYLRKMTYKAVEVDWAPAMDKRNGCLSSLSRVAGERGLRGSIVRPGYILGDSETGVCNIDDFLIRMLKGCIQLSARPRIINTVNPVPVNHVARVVVAAALNSLTGKVHVIRVTGHPRL
ncbi:MAG: hypothetical protein Q9166_004371, partial [cf. Caloplaca sp. 2 TL-2023]